MKFADVVSTNNRADDSWHLHLSGARIPYPKDQGRGGNPGQWFSIASVKQCFECVPKFLPQIAKPHNRVCCSMSGFKKMDFPRACLDDYLRYKLGIWRPLKDRFNAIGLRTNTVDLADLR